MLDIRLDFISEFKDKPVAMSEMIEIRRKFISLDSYLAELGEQCDSPAFKRTVALARTNNEIALQYTIKSLCLLHEKKE